MASKLQACSVVGSKERATVLGCTVLEHGDRMLHKKEGHSFREVLGFVTWR